MPRAPAFAEGASPCKIDDSADVAKKALFYWPVSRTNVTD